VRAVEAEKAEGPSTSTTPTAATFPSFSSLTSTTTSSILVTGPLSPKLTEGAGTYGSVSSSGNLYGSVSSTSSSSSSGSSSTTSSSGPSSSSSTTAPNSTVVSGWVSKKSGTNFLWQDRLLALSSTNVLSYYKSQEDKVLENPAGSISLADASRVEASPKDNGGRFMVHMVDGSRIYHFSASTPEVAKQWVNYLGMGIAAAKR